MHRDRYLIGNGECSFLVGRLNGVQGYDGERWYPEEIGKKVGGATVSS